ncbi:hypothetical protein [Streptomyces sp. NPDC023327]|uniref:hypothetical protein n=1 Tax=Streptomyces sp. NPDC023327 TaxID=3157088 RepID=UPI0033FB4AB0
MSMAEVRKVDRVSAREFEGIVEKLRGTGSATEDAARSSDTSPEAYMSFHGSSVALETLAKLPGLSKGFTAELREQIPQISGIKVGNRLALTPLDASVHVDQNADMKLKAFRVSFQLLPHPVPLLSMGEKSLTLQSVVLDLSWFPASATYTIAAALDVKLTLGKEWFAGFVSLPDGRLECELVLGEEAAVRPEVHTKVIPENIPLPDGWPTGPAGGQVHEPARISLVGSLRHKVFTLAVDLPGERGEMAGITVEDLLLSLSVPGLAVSFEGTARMSDTRMQLFATLDGRSWQIKAYAAPVNVKHVKSWASDKFGSLPEVVDEVQLSVVGIEAEANGISLNCVGAIPLDHSSGRGISFSLHAKTNPPKFSAAAALSVNRGQGVASLTGDVTAGDLTLSWEGDKGVRLSPSALGIPVDFPDFLTPVLTSLTLHRTRTKNNVQSTWVVAGSTPGTAFVLASTPKQPPSA